jgi:hypothetical protein
MTRTSAVGELSATMSFGVEFDQLAPTACPARNPSGNCAWTSQVLHDTSAFHKTFGYSSAVVF